MCCKFPPIMFRHVRRIKDSIFWPIGKADLIISKRFFDAVLYTFFDVNYYFISYAISQIGEAFFEGNPDYFLYIIFVIENYLPMNFCGAYSGIGYSNLYFQPLGNVDFRQIK